MSLDASRSWTVEDFVVGVEPVSEGRSSRGIHRAGIQRTPDPWKERVSRDRRVYDPSKSIHLREPSDLRQGGKGDVHASNQGRTSKFGDGCTSCRCGGCHLAQAKMEWNRNGKEQAWDKMCLARDEETTTREKGHADESDHGRRRNPCGKQRRPRIRPPKQRVEIATTRGSHPGGCKDPLRKIQGGDRKERIHRMGQRLNPNQAR